MGSGENGAAGDACDMDGSNREAEWSFWEKRHRRQSREGSGERAGKRTSFKWTVKSVRVTDKSRGSERINGEANEFQSACERHCATGKPRAIEFAAAYCFNRESHPGALKASEVSLLCVVPTKVVLRSAWIWQLSPE